MMTDKYRRCHEMQTPQGPGFLAETGMRNAAAGSSFSFLPVASISEHVNTNYAEIMKAKLCPRASVSPPGKGSGFLRKGSQEFRKDLSGTGIINDQD